MTTGSGWIAPLVLLVLAALGVPGCTDDGAERATVSFTTNDATTTTGVLDVADTVDERRQGLMGVERLPADEGMLFVFDEAGAHSFWMKDTLIPLDIAFWGSDGRINTILGMVPCEADEACRGYVPDEAAVYALEMNAGWFAEHGVEVGDRADVEFLTQ